MNTTFNCFCLIVTDFKEESSDELAEGCRCFISAIPTRIRLGIS